jgi:hypothetical protein
MPSGLVAGLDKRERVRIAQQMDRLVKSLEKNTKLVEQMAKQMDSLVRVLAGAAAGK